MSIFRATGGLLILSILALSFAVVEPVRAQYHPPRECIRDGGEWVNSECVKNQAAKENLQKAPPMHRCGLEGNYWVNGRCLTPLQYAHTPKDCRDKGGYWDGSVAKCIVPDEDSVGDNDGGSCAEGQEEVPGRGCAGRRETLVKRNIANKLSESECLVDGTDELGGYNENRICVPLDQLREGQPGQVESNQSSREAAGQDQQQAFQEETSNQEDQRAQQDKGDPPSHEDENSKRASPGEAGGSDYDPDAASYADASIQQCQQAQQEARSCCNNPLKCTLGIDLGDGGAMQTIVLGGAAAAVGGQGNIQKACKTMKALGGASMTLNAAGAAKCSSRKNTCLEICQSLHQEFGHLAQVTDPANPNYRSYTRAEQQLTVLVNRCQSYEEQVNAQAMQAVQSGYAAKMAELCQETATTAQATDWDAISDQPVFNGDCSDPANASNPVCQNPCNKPGAENNPFCREAVPGLDDGSSSQSSSSGGGFSHDPSSFADAGDFNAGKDMDGEEQASTLGDSINPQPTRNPGVPSNGGGFAGGSGGGGGMPELPSTGGQARGPSTDILKGVSGGGGYSVSQGGGFSSGGGFSGYGTSGAISRSKGKKFDLRQYLPGAQKDPKRWAAGKRPSLHPEIGAAHMSIFEMVSRRYKLLCKLRRAIGCK